ncbi:MAG: hypothetical protein GF331_03890 [Chitinivibrionales bacterium]|nr:hypothetical protein [Chitinivibrionales bacterium]
MPTPFALLLCLLAPTASDSSSDSDSGVHALPPLEVREQRQAPPGRIDIDEREELVGRSDDLNNLLFLEPGVARTPEAGSRMMVEGDSPFDNRIQVRDIPLLAPSHFAGLLFTDRSILPMALPNQVDFHTEDMAGRFGGVSGSLLRLEPGIATSQYSPHKVQALLNYGTLGADLSLMVPFYRTRQRYQLTFRASDRFSIWMDNIAFGRDDANPYLGYAEPSSFWDIQVLGEQRAGPVVLKQLSFTSMDNYVSSLDTVGTRGRGFDVDEDRMPWGIHAFTVGDSTGPQRWQISLGGSHQYHFAGTRIDTMHPLVQARHSAAGATVHLGPKLFRAPLTLRIDGVYRDWDGSLEHRRLHFDADSSHGDTVLARSGSDSRIGMHLGATRPAGSVHWGAQTYAALLLPGRKAVVDPGLHMRIILPHSHVRLATGITTSQPDIRGLPSPSFRQTRIHTYRADLEARTQPRQWLTLAADAYAKWRDHALVFTEDPLLRVWDESRTASQLSLGTAFTADIHIGSRVRLWTQHNLSYTRLIDNGETQLCPWDIPWTNKSILSCAVVPKHILVYLLATFAEGTPYRAPVAEAGGGLTWDEYSGRTPVYKRVDAKIELRHETDKRFHVLQYDAYVLAENIWSGFQYMWGDEWEDGNVREYWWDDELEPHPVYLSPFDIHFGVRAHVRF